MPMKSPESTESLLSQINRDANSHEDQDTHISFLKHAKRPKWEGEMHKKVSTLSPQQEHWCDEDDKGHMLPWSTDSRETGQHHRSITSFPIHAEIVPNHMLFWWYQWRWQSSHAFGLRSSYWKTSQTFTAPCKTALSTSTAKNKSPKSCLKDSGFAVCEPSLFSPLICAGRLIFSSIWTEKKKRHQFIFWILTNPNGRIRQEENCRLFSLLL